MSSALEFDVTSLGQMIMVSAAIPSQDSFGCCLAPPGCGHFGPGIVLLGTSALPASDFPKPSGFLLIGLVAL